MRISGFPLLVRISDSEGDVIHENTVDNVTELRGEVDSILQVADEIVQDNKDWMTQADGLR